MTRAGQPDAARPEGGEGEGIGLAEDAGSRPLDSPAPSGVWTVVGSAVKGMSHIADGRPCQDSLAWFVDDGLVLAVADGAGSAPAADAGSWAAVNQVVESYKRLRLDSERDRVHGGVAVQRIFQEARSSVQDLATRSGLPASHYHTTLAIAFLWDDVLYLGQVGDGIVVVEQEGALIDAAPGMHGEYANEAVFLTGGPALPATTTTSVPAGSVRGVAMSTDGLYMVATDVARGRTPFAPFFEDVFAAVRSGANSTDIESFLKRVDDRTGDDKSLLVAIQGPGSN